MGKLRQVLFVVLFLLGDGREQDDCHSAERLGVHEASGDLEKVHEGPDLLAQSTGAPMVAAFRETETIDQLSVESPELSEKWLVERVFLELDVDEVCCNEVILVTLSLVHER